MKYLIPFLFLIVGCKASPQVHHNTVSLIVLTDTIVGYQGKLDKNSVVERIPVSEKDFMTFMTKVCGHDSSIEILMKPEAMGNVGGNMQLVKTWCKELKLAEPKMVPSSAEDKQYLGFTGMPQQFWDQQNNPAPMHLNLPKEEGANAIIQSDKTYTILLLKNDIAYIYLGKKPEQKIILAKISDDQFRNTIVEGQKKYKEDFAVIIKPSKDASYKNTVDLLDLMITNDIKKYAMADGNDADAAFAEKLQLTSN